ncbi:hypothetical protein IFR05_010658 [Cadophora sp. M221]|nr:hypothetical protein IFR05_010658 [Cadophora sp. M221]
MSGSNNRTMNRLDSVSGRNSATSAQMRDAAIRDQESTNARIRSESPTRMGWEDYYKEIQSNEMAQSAVGNTNSNVVPPRIPRLGARAQHDSDFRSDSNSCPLVRQDGLKEIQDSDLRIKVEIQEITRKREQEVPPTVEHGTASSRITAPERTEPPRYPMHPLSLTSREFKLGTLHPFRILGVGLTQIIYHGGDTTANFVRSSTSSKFVSAALHVAMGKHSISDKSSGKIDDSAILVFGLENIVRMTASQDWVKSSFGSLSPFIGNRSLAFCRQRMRRELKCNSNVVTVLGEDLLSGWEMSVVKKRIANVATDLRTGSKAPCIILLVERMDPGAILSPWGF